MKPKPGKGVGVIRAWAVFGRRATQPFGMESYCYTYAYQIYRSRRNADYVANDFGGTVVEVELCLVTPLKPKGRRGA